MTIDGDELGGGYGHPTTRGGEMIRRAARHGLLLDPVYTAKAMASLSRRAAERHDETLVFFTTQHGKELGDDGDLESLPPKIRALARP